MRDVIAVKSAVCLVGSVLFNQLALASHALLCVLPRVIKVGNVQQNAYQCPRSTHARGFHKVCHALRSDRFNKVSYHHEEDNEQIIISHLHVVGVDFKGSEDRSNNETPQIFAPISEHNARNHRWKIGQSHDFPDVSGGNDDEEIR